MFPLADAIQYFKDHEGVVNHMYLDVVGLVTVGVGFLLEEPTEAQAMNFVRRATRAPASAAEKAADWQAVLAQPKARQAKFYKKFTQLDLPAAEVDKELERLLVTEFAPPLRQRFPRFDQFPKKAQIGLLDMIYSLGRKGLVTGYPKFCAAVDREDWRACGREGSRRGVADSRNADLKKLFRDAASEV